MPVWREKTTWIPAYVLLLIYLIRQFGLKGLYIILALVATVGLGDSLSHRLIKKQVERPRPCQVLEEPEELRLLVKCGGGYSFTSNHATNHFAVAVFLILVLGHLWGPWKWLLLVWAASIAYGQVYVGLHYPADILVGALLGSGIAWLTATLLKNIVLNRKPES